MPTKGKATKPQESGNRSPVRYQKKTALYIVGLGASAGGLEALELFLRNVPEGSGMAFVIVQHLDPTRKGMMVELLQRATAMKVVQVKNRTLVRPDRVYLIPPNKDMSILRGVLYLFDPITPRGLRLPIDFFFRSLAEDMKDQSIAVILSGMGSDGKLGLKSIRDKSGMIFVQEPTSAKFDSMPRSAIDAGLADIVAPVEALPGEIIERLKHKHTRFIVTAGSARENQPQGDVEKVLILLRAQTGQDFSLYKKNTVNRRIDRRMSIHKIDKIAAYVRFVQVNPQELELLFKELLIGVTSFFRDPKVWEKLKTEVIPALLKDHPPRQPLRAWVPGCSTGEEAYSLGIVFKEALEQIRPASNFTLQIFATDLDQDAIRKAREGIFPHNIAADVSPERLSRFFVEVEQGYHIAKTIREMVVFAPQNLLMDPPFTRLELLSCRNVLIYLTTELQKILLPIFHYSLNHGGFLLLGSAETIAGFTDLFTPLDGKERLYRRIENGNREKVIEFSSPIFPVLPVAQQQTKASKTVANLQSLADQLLLQQYSPAAVVVNQQGEILYFSGRTGKYLEPAAGKANLNIFTMVHDGLSYDLNKAFQKALRQKNAVTVNNVEVETNVGVQAVKLTVQVIEKPKALAGMVIIVFMDVETSPETKVPGKAGRPDAGEPLLSRIEDKLEQTRQDNRTMREEMQTFEEEFKSAKEELQSTNEELQSTNEELTTSKEEMQSMNEEMQTLNFELQTKVNELSRLNNDMKNLIESTEVTTLFLDKALRVRVFTTVANRIFRLIPDDVGRPITDITSDLNYPELADHVREVLRELVFHEQEVDAHDGRWFRVRIMPYSTVESIIDGVVITFMDITASKRMEEELRRKQANMEKYIVEQNTKLANDDRRIDH